MKIGDDDPEFPRSLFSITGFVLVLVVISFFRSAFLPFARFVGGVILIVKMVIPFLIVSVLLICAFLYGFYMTKHAYCDTFVGCIQLFSRPLSIIVMARMLGSSTFFLAS